MAVITIANQTKIESHSRQSGLNAVVGVPRSPNRTLLLEPKPKSKRHTKSLPYKIPLEYMYTASVDPI